MIGRALLVSFLLACASTRSSTTIEQSWRAPHAEQRPRNVVTLYSSRDGSVRRTLEDKMAYKLRRGGIAATPSYAVVETDLRDPRQMRDELLAHGYDGVVAIRPVGESPEAVTAMTVDHGGDPPPVAATTDFGFVGVIARLEVEVYSLPEDRLVYTAMSKTIDPDGISTVIDEVTTLVAREIDRQGVFVATLR
ncbi:MAG TPA: hypothetical protein VL326_13740 [Kofleriaceae bacterium]|jgi:hypothetical protein|nr:hypothetical protein [Kofleriaceae bacterium]